MMMAARYALALFSSAAMATKALARVAAPAGTVSGSRLLEVVVVHER